MHHHLLLPEVCFCLQGKVLQRLFHFCITLVLVTIILSSGLCGLAPFEAWVGPVTLPGVPGAEAFPPVECDLCGDDWSSCCSVATSMGVLCGVTAEGTPLSKGVLKVFFLL